MGKVTKRGWRSGRDEEMKWKCMGGGEERRGEVRSREGRMRGQDRTGGGGGDLIELGAGATKISCVMSFCCARKKTSARR
eukprot:752509-Hanusia_phi.AAC.1